MSILAITAGHFASIPVRYAVGRWYNLPTSTMIAFNMTDIGLKVLLVRIIEYARKKQWKMHTFIAVSLISRIVIVLTGVYAASILTGHMPLMAAFLSHFVTIIPTVIVMYQVTAWEQKK